MMVRKILPFAFVLALFIFIGVWYFRHQDKSTPTSLDNHSSSEPIAETLPDDTEEIPPESEDEDEFPDPSKVEEVNRLELLFSNLSKENPESEEQVKPWIAKLLIIIDQLMRMHPKTSLRYAELLEERFSWLESLLILENASRQRFEKAHSENLQLARDYVASQPKQALAYELLGLQLLVDRNKGEARQAFETCIRLEPSNTRCRQNLAKLIRVR